MRSMPDCSPRLRSSALKPMQTLLSFLVASASIYVALCASVFLMQRSQIYFPPAESGHPDAEALWLDSHGERLRIWTVVRPGSRALIYFGGNAEDVAGTVDFFSSAFPNHSLYVVNYRGYGGSSGRPSEKALFADALTVYDHLQAKYTDISVMGRSLGSGVAVHLASERRVTKLVLVTAYDSLVNVARQYYWYLPVGLLLRDRYDSASRAGEVKAPVLLVTAGEDEIVAAARSEALAAAFAPGQAKLAAIPYMTHNSLDLTPDYLDTVREFLDAPGTS